MRSGEVLMEDPSEIHEQKPEEYAGQKVEGFDEGKPPQSITLKDGATFERGFTEEKTGNVFYSKPLENDTMREILLIDQKGIILKRFIQQEGDIKTAVLKRTQELQKKKDEERRIAREAEK